jgi:hypothetical protein
MKHAVLYGSARKGDNLIVTIKKSQRVPFPGRHDCRWTAACINETNKWVRAHGRLSPPYLCVKPAPSKVISLRVILTQRIFTVMAFKEVYDCEILISKIEKRPAL